MKPLVYVETTIPSYYCDNRPGLAAEIARTRQWWDQERGAYACYISAVVLDELMAGNYPNQAACLALVKGLPLLQVSPEVRNLASQYQVHGLMPKPPVADALHVALASHYRLDFLLTWNCRHLANPNKTKQLEVLNRRLGVSVPQLITPNLLKP